MSEAAIRGAVDATREKRKRDGCSNAQKQLAFNRADSSDLGTSLTKVKKLAVDNAV